jgi:hypothetical protein
MWSSSAGGGVGVDVGRGDGVAVGIGVGVARRVDVHVGEGMTMGVAVARENNLAGILASAHPDKPLNMNHIHRADINHRDDKAKRTL